MSCLFSKTNGFKSLSLKNPPDLPLYKGPKSFMGCFEGRYGWIYLDCKWRSDSGLIYN